MIDDSNCHCGPCTAMNEPLTLEGDIRYLKAHIETKNRQLAEKDAAIADAKLTAGFYLEAWRDAEGAAIRLDKKNSQLLTRITELEDTIMRLGEEKRIGGLGHNLGLQQENERLNKELEASRGQVLNQLQIIPDLRKEKEALVNELYEAIGRIGGIVNEINV